MVYINQELEKSLSKVNIYTYQRKDFPVIDREHVYSSKIPGDVVMLIEEDNRKLKDEILDYQAT